MSLKNLLLCAIIAVGSVAMPAQAQINVNIHLGTAPPAPHYEAVPAPRSGYAWAPGYWRWDGARHVWAPGRWLEARPGSYWVSDRWEASDGRHHYKAGHWKQGKQKKVKHADKSKGHGKGWAKGHDRD